jgi:hypothetical protein
VFSEPISIVSKPEVSSYHLKTRRHAVPLKTLVLFTPVYGGRCTVVGIETRYGLDGPGIESECRRDTPCSFRPTPDAHPAPFLKGAGSLQGQSGRGVVLINHPLLGPSLRKVWTLTSVSFLCLHRHSMGWPLTYLSIFTKLLYLFYYLSATFHVEILMTYSN